jgi:hypothetical protein
MDYGYRCPILRPNYARVQVALIEARADLAAQQARHLEQYSDLLRELASLKSEIGELREVLGLVVATTRTWAEADVATLRRQLETALARIERRPDKPLH